MPSVAIVEAALRLDAKQFSKGIEQAKAEVKKLAGDSRAIGAAAGAGLLAISTGAGALALSLKASADEADAIADSLAGAFKDSPGQLDAVTKKVLELGSLGIFTEEQFGGAAQRLQNFGKDAASNLTRVADIAAKTGASFDAVSESLARFGKDEKATKQLLKITGIKVGDLAGLGAVLDKTGTSLDITGKNGEKAVQALEALADRDFSGAFLKGTDGASRFSSELKLLKQELGAGIVTVFEELGDKAAPVLKFFRGFSDEAKGLVGVGILFTAAAAGVGAIAVAAGLAATSLAASITAAGGLAAVVTTLGTVSGIAGGALATIVGTLSGFAAAGLLATGVVLGLYKAYDGLINLAAKDLKQQNELLATELQRQAYQKIAPKFYGKTAQELYDVGLTALDAQHAVEGLQQQLAQRIDNGDQAGANVIKERIAEIKAAQAELEKLENRDRGNVAARAAAADPAVVAAEDKARKDRADKERKQREEDLSEALDDIDLQLAQQEISQAEALELRRQALIQYEADEEKKRALAIETARFESDAANDAAAKAKADGEATRKQRYEDEIQRIGLLSAQRKISAQQEADLLKKVANTFELTQDEKVQTLQKVAQIEGQLADSTAAKRKAILEKQAADEKAAADKRKQQAIQDAQDLQAAQDQGRTLKGQALNTQVQDLQAQTETTGKDNTSAIKAAAAERLKLDLEQIRLEADKQKAATQSAEAREQIEANATEAIKQKQREASDNLKSELQKQLEALAKFEDDKKKTSSLGGTFGIEELGSRSSLGFGVGRDRADAISSVSTASLFANVAAPKTTVPNDPSFDKLSSAADVLLAAAGKLNSAADKEPKVTVVQQGGSSPRSAPSGDGRQGSLVTTGRSTTRRS